MSTLPDDSSKHRLRIAVADTGTAPVEADWQEFSDYYTADIGLLVAFCCALGASKENAADLAQDVMLKLWKNWTRVGYPRAYTRTIAIRDWSTRRRMPEDIVGVHTDIIDETARNPLDFTITRVEFRRTLEHLRKLPTRQRQVITLTFDGFNTGEIAEILDISSDAVRASCYQARAKLRRIIDDESRRNDAES